MFNQLNSFFWWNTFVAAVAGLWTIVHIILSVAGVEGDDYWGVALLILFFLALILAFTQYPQERLVLKAAASTDRFPEPAISKFFFGSDGSAVLWFVVRMYVGAEWLLAGLEKVTSPVWGASGKALAGFTAGALAKSSGANPAVQGWYEWFLQHTVLPNAGLFSVLVSWGEVAVGLGLLLGILTGIAAGFGVLMN